MSQINDALKRAKKMQQPDTPFGAAPLPPVEPASPASRGGIGWLLPAVIIFLIAAACTFIVLAFAGRTTATENTATVPQTNAVKTLTPGK